VLGLVLLRRIFELRQRWIRRCNRCHVGAVAGCRPHAFG